jgi:hypothetical protein
MGSAMALAIALFGLAALFSWAAAGEWLKLGKREAVGIPWHGPLRSTRSRALPLGTGVRFRSASIGSVAVTRAANTRVTRTREGGSAIQ